MPKVGEGGISKPAVDYSKYKTDSIMSFGKGNIFVHGPRGAGKTRLAATISEQWNPDRKDGRLIKLEDIVWLKFEETPTTTLIAHGHVVDEIDLVAMVRDIGITDFVFKTSDILPGLLGPDVKTIVIDTLSEWARMVELHYMRSTLVPSDREVNTRALWVALRNLHSEWRNRLQEAKGNRRIIYLCHSKPIADLAAGSSEAAVVQKKNEEIRDAAYGRGEAEPDVTGVNSVGYESGCDIVGAMKRVRGLKGDSYTFLPKGDLVFGGKHRLGDFLAQEEKPDLRAMIDRVRAQMKEVTK